MAVEAARRRGALPKAETLPANGKLELRAEVAPEVWYVIHADDNGKLSNVTLTEYESYLEDKTKIIPTDFRFNVDQLLSHLEEDEKVPYLKNMLGWLTASFPFFANNEIFSRITRISTFLALYPQLQPHLDRFQPWGDDLFSQLESNYANYLAGAASQ